MVTGAGSGIGRAVALALAAAGAEVILLGRTVRKLEAVHAEIAALGGPEASIVPLDLERALAADYEAVAAAVQKRYGRLDGLLHNAALLGALTPIEQYEVPMFMRVMHVNVTAAFVLTQHLLPLLRASKDASVLFTSSGVGTARPRLLGRVFDLEVRGGRIHAGAGARARGHVVGAREHHRSGQGAHRDAPPGLSFGVGRVAADAGIADRALSRLVRPREPWRHGTEVFGSAGLSRAWISSSSSWRNCSARQTLVELQTTHRHAQHAAHQRALASRRADGCPCRWRRVTTMEYQRFEPSSCASLVETLSTVMRDGRSILPLFTPSM